MTELKKGDVVVHNLDDDPSLTTAMLFYVLDSKHDGDPDLRQITARPKLAWLLRLPANELELVGHIDGDFMLQRFVATEAEREQVRPIVEQVVASGRELNRSWLGI